MINHPINLEAAVVLDRLGGDTSNFAARQLTSRMASDADLVLTMTRAHRDAVLELAPRQLHRTFTMVEAARLISEHNAFDVADLAAYRSQLDTRGLTDVPDPIGRDGSVFSAVGAQIAELLPPIMKLCRAG